MCQLNWSPIILKFRNLFTNVFKNLVPGLDLKVLNNLLCQTRKNGEEVLAAIFDHKNHPSITQSLKKCNFSFSFKARSLTDAESEMKSLDTNKVSNSSDLPTKILKQNLDFFSSSLSGHINKSISLSTLPSILKLAYIPQYIKNICDTRKVTIGLSYQINIKSLKIYCITKFPLLMNICSLNIFAQSSSSNDRKI